jgi:predicted lysophospholipase L1 biosynthesis ABC-type transport system permease subunit
MMNRLAVAPESILVPDSFMQEHNFNIGDVISMTIVVRDLMSINSDFLIAGTYNYFPTVYDDQITFIGNLDYINTLTGLTVAHDIWLKLKPDTNTKEFLKNMTAQLGISASSATNAVRDANAMVVAEQGRMERVGIFGTLSVGFLAAALMAILGLLVYSYASLQERAYRLAVLNAVGLSRNQIMAQVVMEYAFLALFGAVAGALIGLATSELFIPFFRFTGEKGIATALPPLLPIIASGQLRNLSLIFGVSIVVIEVGSMASILHNRLIQILKRVWM